MKFKTSVKSLVELVRANIDLFPSKTKPKRDGFQFFDLHVHLYAPTPVEVPKFLKILTKQVDGTTLANYAGHAPGGIKTYEQITEALKAYCPKNYSIDVQQLVTKINNLETEEQSILFRSEEFDRTSQNLDIMLVGIEKDAPIDRDIVYDARKIAEKGRENGAFTYLEHFCAKPAKILPWKVVNYDKLEDKKDLFDIFYAVDAVETFNGQCVLWMPPQNPLSEELVKEYEDLYERRVITLAGSDTHSGLSAVGTAGVLIPKLDFKLEGKELIQQLKDNLKLGPVSHKKKYNGVPSFIRQRLKLRSERKKLKRQ